jgi:Flp pilus assembly pilin Flp
MFKRRHGKSEQFWSDCNGATAIEYAMLVLLIGLVLIGLQTSIGSSVSGFFYSMAAGL